MSDFTQPARSHADPDFNPFGPDAPSRAESVDVIGLIRRSQKTIFFGLLCGLLLGVLTYLYLGPTYTASTKLLVSLQASADDDNTGDRTFSDRAGHLQLLKSDKILERAVEIGELDQLESLAAAGDKTEAISDKMTVKRESGDDRAYQNVFSLGYESPSKEDGAKVVDAIVAAYQEYLVTSRDESNTQVIGAVAGSESDLREQIEKLQAEHLKFRSETPLHWNAPVGVASGNGQQQQANYHMTRLNTIEDDRLATETEIAGIKARIDALEAMRASNESPEALEFFVLTMISQPAAAGAGGGEQAGGVSVSAGPSAGAAAKSALTSELIKVMVARSRDMISYGPESDAVKKHDERINTIADLYVAEGLTPPNIEAIKAGEPVDRPNLVETYVTSLRLKLKELAERKTELEKLYETASDEARKAAVYELQDKQFADKLAVLQKAWENTALQQDKLKMTAAQKGYVAEQITPTRVELALKRVIKIVGAFGSLGMLLTLLGVYAGEMQNTYLRNADEAARYTGVSVLGTVPHFAEPTDASLSLARQSGLSPSLRYYHAPGSADAEAFRSVRTAIFHSDLPRDAGAIIQVTSAEPGDGKSTVAGNLAAAVAQSGKRVLLIDADLRRPTAHDLFGVRGETGLTDVLTGELGWENAVRSTGVDRLSVMPAGSRTDMPAELLSNSNLGGLLETAKREFDFVVLDTPPLLAVSDPCIVAPYADTTLLVIRLNKNKRDHATKSLEMVRSHGMKVLGVVVNDSALKATAYYPEYHRPDPTPTTRVVPQQPKHDEFATTTSV